MNEPSSATAPQPEQKLLRTLQAELLTDLLKIIEFDEEDLTPAERASCESTIAQFTLTVCQEHGAIS